MKTILLIDEDELFADTLHAALVRFGYDVVCARTGTEALERYDRQKMDLVLIHLVSPNQQGLELITELYQAHPAMKIITISGGGRNDPQFFLKIAHYFGAMRVLSKPFQQTELQQVLKDSLEAA